MIPQNAGAPSHELIFETLIAYQRSAALRAVIELNLFRAIGEGPGDIASLARQCGASQRGIRILCDYLTILGLLAKEDGRYRHHAQQRGIPGPPSPACIASAARFLGHPALAEPFVRLADVVRSGHTILPETVRWSRRIPSGAWWRRKRRPKGKMHLGGHKKKAAGCILTRNRESKMEIPVKN
jgi:hypothetical protein